MKTIIKAAMLTLLIAALALIATGCAPSTEQVSKDETVTIINVSYDPTREFYAAYNAQFADYYKEKTGITVEVTQSHGGSGAQALAVAQGLPADVVTLALEGDVRAVANEGLIEDGWLDEFEGHSAPYTSAIVFLVRAGNPKGIKDWDDLTKEGVGVITPNPKTSGGARWNFLAACAFAERLYGGDEAQIDDFMARLFGNVLVLDSGARGSTTSFVENGQGDVLIAWENEAYLTLKQHADSYEIVSPSISILCQPTVGVVDEVATKRGTEEVAKEYLAHLYTDEAQRLAAEHYYRPSNAAILNEFADRFNLTIEMTTIEHFGGWQAAQAKYFAEGGVFDQIYEK